MCILDKISLKYDIEELKQKEKELVLKIQTEKKEKVQNLNIARELENVSSAIKEINKIRLYSKHFVTRKESMKRLLIKKMNDSIERLRQTGFIGDVVIENFLTFGWERLKGTKDSSIFSSFSKRTSTVKSIYGELLIGYSDDRNVYFMKTEKSIKKIFGSVFTITNEERFKKIYLSKFDKEKFELKRTYIDGTRIFYMSLKQHTVDKKNYSVSVCGNKFDDSFVSVLDYESADLK